MVQHKIIVCIETISDLYKPGEPHLIPLKALVEVIDSGRVTAVEAGLSRDYRWGLSVACAATSVVARWSLGG
jgi:hypothetical protein